MKPIKRKDCLNTSVVAEFLGRPWTIKVLTQAQYFKVHKEKTSDAACALSAREIHFRGQIWLPHVVHELYHAKVEHMTIASTTELSVDDFEEMNAEWLHMDLPFFLKDIKRIYALIVGEAAAERDYEAYMRGEHINASSGN